MGGVLTNYEISPLIVFFASIILAAIMMVEVGYMLLAKNHSGKSRINRRMKVSNEDISQHDILVKLRKERGMNEAGGLRLPIQSLNKLIIQAGIKSGLGNFFLYYSCFVFLASAAIFVGTSSLIVTLISLPFTGFGIPILWLKRLKNKKLLKFGQQLPEAIDLVTRSLKAGHPVPVAISMVASEMSDPIGTEFGIVVDEVTYGSDLVTGLIGLYDRVNHPDLPLLVSAVSIQSTTGGNLREILESLSVVVRNRLKMKAKIRAISAEGRMSAIFLSALPFAIFLALLGISPSYYGEIWSEDITYYLMGGLLFWLVCGNLLIMKMISVKV